MKRHFRHHPDGSRSDLPAAIIQGVEHPMAPEGRVVHISVQAAKDKSGEIPATFAQQCAIAMTHVEHMLAASQMRLEDMVRVTCYVTSRAHVQDFHRAFQHRWPGIAPVVSVLVVAGLANPDVLIGFEAQAYAGPETRLRDTLKLVEVEEV